jgi:hypothetical protein
MRAILRFMAVGMALLIGCSPPPPPPPRAPTVTPVLNLKQLMEWVIDPAADVIWDSVKTIYTLAGTQEVRPQTDEQWDNVRNGAATLVESVNLLVMEGRARDNKEWTAAANRLGATAQQALKAAEAKNVEALFSAGAEIYNACRACHQRYAPEPPDPAPQKAAK